MASRASKQKDNTINIHSYPVQMHVGSQKFVNDDWGTMAYIIDRREVQNKFTDPELRYNCIYFLFGYENNMEMCYVGQAKIRNDGESVLARLREHDKSTTEKYRDIWDWAVVVTNKNGSWTLDDLNALEHAFYAEIPVEQNLNGNNPNAGGADFDSYIDKIEQIKALVTTIGFSIFAKKTQTENIQVTSETNEFSIVEDLQNGMARIPEIVTPHKVVKAMVDMLPADVWNDKTVFLDPACKGGEYLREIYDRLMENEAMQSKYPNDIERSNHILSEQLYGIALSQVSLERTTKKLMGFGMNIRVIPNYIEILKTKFDKEVSEAYKYEYIMNILNKEFGKTMNIDVVIGNPPYQEMTGQGRQGTPIYNRFMEMGMRISNIGIWITPSRWFSGGIGLDNFRHYILGSKRISLIKNYKQAQKVFNGVDIAGGVCITNICKHSDKIKFVDGETNNNIIVDSEFIKEKEMLLDRCEAYSIIDKTKSTKYMSSIVLALNAFDLPTNFEGNVIKTDDYDIEVLGSYNSISYANLDEINKGLDIIAKYKVLTGIINPDRGGVTNSESSNVINKPRILNPNQVCTHTYIVIAVTNDYQTADIIIKYIKTKFTRFLVLITLASMHISAKSFKFVPLQDFTENSDIDWSQPIGITSTPQEIISDIGKDLKDCKDKSIDAQLYRKYNLSEEEIAYIEKTIKPME